MTAGIIADMSNLALKCILEFQRDFVDLVEKVID
jgi:hypothetical protein